MNLKWITELAGLGLMVGIIGCQSAQVDRSAARAKEGAPEVAKVDILTLPFDASLPRFVVAVVPFDQSASDVISGSGAPTAPGADGSPAGIVTGGLKGGSSSGESARSGGGPGQIGAGLAAQLKTAMSRWGNISIIDAAALSRQSDGTYSCKLQPGEIGPFIVRGTVTEFNETADLKQEKSGGSLGGLGAVLGIAGAVAGVPEAGYTGAGIAAANPTIQNEKTTRMGMVGIDMEIVDGRSARVLGAFNSSGTFTTMSAIQGASVFGIGGGSADFAASALGQATRAAMNEALRQSADVLRRAPR